MALPEEGIFFAATRAGTTSRNVAFGFPSSPLQETFKLNRAPVSHPIKFNLAATNPVMGVYLNPHEMFKGKRLQNHDITALVGSTDSNSEGFKPHRVSIERNFQCIDYLKMETQNGIIETQNDCSNKSIIARKKKASEIVNARMQELQQQTRNQIEKTKQKISKATVAVASFEDFMKKREESQNRNKNRSISNSSSSVAPASSTVTTPAKKVEGLKMFAPKSKQKQNVKSMSHRLHSSSSHKNDGTCVSNSCSSCCQISVLSSIEKLRNTNRSACVLKRTSSASSKGTSVKDSKCSDFGSEKNLKIRSVMSSSSSSRTAEHLAAKISKIVQRREEKHRFMDFLSSEKALSEQLYGVFSRQARDEKKRKHSEVELFQKISQKFATPKDHPMINRVNQIIHASLKNFSAAKRESEEESRRILLEKIQREQAVEEYSENVRQVNQLYVRESSVKERSIAGGSFIGEGVSGGGQQLHSLSAASIPWGVDQRRFKEDKNAVVEKPVKMILKEKVDFKQLFRKAAEDVNGGVQKSLLAQQQKVIVAPTRNNCSKDRAENGEEKKRKRDPISKEEFERKQDERVRKILEMKSSEAKEIRNRKERIANMQLEVERKRQDSLNKCKKKPFKPDEETISTAFKIIDSEDQEFLDQSPTKVEQR